MADARDALALIGRRGREQRARGREQQPVPLLLPHPAQKIPVEYAGGAAAAAAAAVHVLPLAVKEQQPAIVVVPRHIHAVALEQIHHDVVAQLAEVAGKDKIIILRLRLRVPEHGGERVVGRGGKCLVRAIKKSVPCVLAADFAQLALSRLGISPPCSLIRSINLRYSS